MSDFRAVNHRHLVQADSLKLPRERAGTCPPASMNAPGTVRKPGGHRLRTASRESRLTGRILHAAGKLIRGGRRRRLKIPATWPWAKAIATAWDRITALPHAP